VIGTEGDGAYMFCNPISSHYVSAEMKLPVLTVIFNNGRWQAVRGATVGLNPDGYAAKANRQPLTYLDAHEDYHKAVEVSGGYGEKVTDPAEMMPALERAMKAVTVEKRQAVVNAICTVP
jgi:acetolactate synthase-1/2/3 large subunit